MGYQGDKLDAGCVEAPKRSLNYSLEQEYQLWRGIACIFLWKKILVSQEKVRWESFNKQQCKAYFTYFLNFIAV